MCTISCEVIFPNGELYGPEPEWAKSTFKHKHMCKANTMKGEFSTGKYEGYIVLTNMH